MQDEWLVIGKIVSTQGLKGEMRVHSYSDFPERFQIPGTRWLQHDEAALPQPVELLSGRNLPGKNNLFIIRLGGINDCDGAEALRDCLLMVPQSDRPNLFDNEYHVIDLIGCQVIDQSSGLEIGLVVSIIAAGNDLLEVKNARGMVVLIPFVDAIAPVVNLQQKRIEVLPPKGLISDEWMTISQPLN